MPPLSGGGGKTDGEPPIVCQGFPDQRLLVILRAAEDLLSLDEATYGFSLSAVAIALAPTMISKLTLTSSPALIAPNIAFGGLTP